GGGGGVGGRGGGEGGGVGGGRAGAGGGGGEPFREGHVAAHEFLAGSLVAVAGEAAPELAFAGEPLLGPRSCDAGILCVVLCSHWLPRFSRPGAFARRAAVPQP